MVGDGKMASDPTAGSGILQVHPKDYRPTYEPSKRRITWPNSAIATPNGQKIDTPGSGVPPIFEWQIASYDRPLSGEWFENFSKRSVHD